MWLKIQQNSNLTYRLYDYNRLDKDGNPRELHIKKALDVIDYHKYEPSMSNDELLADNKYFTVKRVEFNKELRLKANESFLSFTFLEGEGTVNDLPYRQYDTFYLPYQKECVIRGKGVVIVSTVR